MGEQETDRILEIDETKTLDKLDSFLRRKLDDSGKNGFIVGLSGGIDSALVASCAVRSAGKESVRTVHINPGKPSSRICDKIDLLSGFLQVECERVDFEDSANKGARLELLMKLVSRSGSIARLLYRLYSMIEGETPHASTLKIGRSREGELDPIKTGALKVLDSWADNVFYAPHRRRRDILEGLGRERNLLPLGAANRSEWMVGWFVKGGIDDLPVQPLLGLYKTQFYQLADYLNLPESIINQTPSPDMMNGINDEFAIGMTYRKLDLILDFIESGGKESLVENYGISQKDIDKVRDLTKLSEWKRGSMAADFVIDGSSSGDLRTQV